MFNFIEEFNHTASIVLVSGHLVSSYKVECTHKTLYWTWLIPRFLPSVCYDGYQICKEAKGLYQAWKHKIKEVKHASKNLDKRIVEKQILGIKEIQRQPKHITSRLNKPAPWTDNSRIQHMSHRETHPRIKTEDSRKALSDQVTDSYTFYFDYRTHHLG